MAVINAVGNHLRRTLTAPATPEEWSLWLRSLYNQIDELVLAANQGVSNQSGFAKTVQSINAGAAYTLPEGTYDILLGANSQLQLNDGGTWTVISINGAMVTDLCVDGVNYRIINNAGVAQNSTLYKRTYG